MQELLDKQQKRVDEQERRNMEQERLKIQHEAARMVGFKQGLTAPCVAGVVCGRSQVGCLSTCLAEFWSAMASF
jgi:hypothetical protein